ncbi:aromatase/cyclase [Lentzea sp. NPDC054927]
MGSFQEYSMVEHEIVVPAAAKEVYALLADVESWPTMFPPSVHVEVLQRDERHERIRIWATANGAVKSWTSRRDLLAESLRISFRQEVSAAPVAAMGGTWIVEPRGEHESRVRLQHDFRAVDDDPKNLAWIEEAVERNSTAELASLQNALVRPTTSFVDTVRIIGSARDVYDFLNDADLWAERLPHVANVAVTEDAPGVQVLRMDTRAKDGSTHTTESVRVCFPHQRIVYKQTTLPEALSLHTGRWEIVEEVNGVVAVSSHHTIAMAEGHDDKLDFARSALSTNSLATLAHAKAHVEGST